MTVIAYRGLTASRRPWIRPVNKVPVHRAVKQSRVIDTAVKPLEHPVNRTQIFPYKRLIAQSPVMLGYHKDIVE